MLREILGSIPEPTRQRLATAATFFRDCADQSPSCSLPRHSSRAEAYCCKHAEDSSFDFVG